MAQEILDLPVDLALDKNREDVIALIRENALKNDLILHKDHWEVLEFVLDVYEACQECRQARKMMRMLETEFKERGGKRYLYMLFPDGPVRQTHELAGLASLHNQTDSGFGTSF